MGSQNGTKKSSWIVLERGKNWKSFSDKNMALSYIKQCIEQEMETGGTPEDYTYLFHLMEGDFKPVKIDNGDWRVVTE
jgi:hypothetical protein